MKLKHISRALAFTAALLYSANVFAGDNAVTTGTTGANASSIVDTPTPNSHDIFTLETTYTGASNVHLNGVIGRTDSIYNDFNYGHRFHVEGNWYLELGLEYQRFDFGGSAGPLPKHLQVASGVISYQYVVQDFPAFAVELRPGWAFENDVTAKNFDVPVDIYSAFPIKKDSVYGMVGAFYGRNFKPEVTPIGGVIWLINDKTRLEALFPRGALIYNFSDDLELRGEYEVNGYGFRTDTTGRTQATYSDARLQYYYVSIGALATYKGWKPFEIGLGAGYNITRQYDFIHYNDSGEVYNAAGAPYVKITFSAKF